MAENPSIHVAGNVSGNIVVGDHNFVVNHNHGTVIYQQAAPQVRARDARPQPPRMPAGFVGRANELARLSAWIGAAEMAVLHGPDGMGKSALLRQAANSPAAQAMPDGVIILEGVDTNGQMLGPDDVVQQLFDALFESNPPLKVNLTTARTYLSNTRPLLLLDEVAIPPSFQRSLLDLFPRAAFLLAADTPAGLDVHRLPMPPLLRADALTLLANKSASVVDDASGPLLDQICGLLHDVPLAISLVGNVLRETGLSLQDCLARLEKIQTSSQHVAQAALDRAFLLAYEMLTPQEKKFLANAALTPSISSSPEWLQYALGSEATTFLERVKSLGLLYANSPRLRIPAGVQMLARAEARQVTSENDLLARLAVFLLMDETPTMPELGNFLAVIRAAQQNGDWQTVLRLARKFNPSLILHGLWETWQISLEACQQAAIQLNDQSSLAWVLHETGTRLIGTGNQKDAISTLRQALDLRQKIGDLTGAAYTRHNLDLLLPLPLPPKTPPQPPTSGGGMPPGLLLTGGLVVVLGILAALIIIVVTLLRPPDVRPPNTPITIPTEPAITLQVDDTLTPTPVVDTQPPFVEPLEPDPNPSYYGRAVRICRFSSQTRLQARVEDPSGIQAVTLRYYYESQANQLRSDSTEVSMQEEENGLYSITLDHNRDERTLQTLDNLDGQLIWEVIATDGLNQTGEPVAGPPLDLQFANCDTQAPVITDMNSPSQRAVYGDGESCGVDFSSAFGVFAEDNEKIARVYVEYHYETSSQTGPTLQFDLAFIDGAYRGTLDHTKDRLAFQTLQTEEGNMFWQVVVEDAAGNSVKSDTYLIFMIFNTCSGN